MTLSPTVCLWVVDILLLFMVRVTSLQWQLIWRSFLEAICRQNIVWQFFAQSVSTRVEQIFSPTSYWVFVTTCTLTNINTIIVTSLLPRRKPEVFIKYLPLRFPQKTHVWIIETLLFIHRDHITRLDCGLPNYKTKMSIPVALTSVLVAYRKSAIDYCGR